MSIYACVHIHTYNIYIRISIHTLLYLFHYMCRHPRYACTRMICKYAGTHVCTHACAHVRMYVCTRVCMPALVYSYTCLHIHLRLHLPTSTPTPTPTPPPPPPPAPIPTPTHTHTHTHKDTFVCVCPCRYTLSCRQRLGRVDDACRVSVVVSHPGKLCEDLNQGASLRLQGKSGT